MRRREFLGAVAAPLVVAPLAAQAAQSPTQSPTPSSAPPPVPPRKGRIKQGVTRGVFGRGVPLDDSCREAARLGICDA